VPLIQEGVEDGTQTTWLLSASYKPSEDSLIYGRAATGYRPGGPNAVPPPSVFPAPNTFDPDELTSYEIGYKGVFADGRLSFEGALFTTDWKDIQIQTSAGGFNFFVNGGKATSKGAEASLLWYPIDSLSLRATYAHTNAELTEDAPLAGGRDGDELPFVPENTFSLGALYQWRMFEGWNASLGGSLDYIGERQSNYSQKASVTVPDYTTFNLNASLEKDHWRFTLYGRNLNDSDGITALGQRGLLPGQNPYAAALITPRMFGVEASYRF